MGVGDADLSRNLPSINFSVFYLIWLKKYTFWNFFFFFLNNCFLQFLTVVTFHIKSEIALDWQEFNFIASEWHKKKIYIKRKYLLHSIGLFHHFDFFVSLFPPTFLKLFLTPFREQLVLNKSYQQLMGVGNEGANSMGKMNHYKRKEGESIHVFM